MARMTKMTVKTTAPKKDDGKNPRNLNAPKYQSNEAQKPLTAKEQEMLKKQWELKFKKKAPAGATFSASNIYNFRNKSGSYSVTTTNQTKGTGSTGVKPTVKKKP